MIINRFLLPARRSQAGQTIIEVIIATAVVTGILTAVAAMLSYSIKNTAEARLRSVGIYKAQEAIEMFQQQRKLLGWDTFVGSVQDGAVYCLSTLPTTSAQFVAMSTAECGGISEYGTEFTRTAEVSIPDINPIREVTVKSVVVWDEGGVERRVELVRQFLLEDV